MKKQKTACNADNNLLLQPLLAQLLERGGGEFDFEGQVIRYYSAADEQFVLVGPWPLHDKAYEVECRELEPTKPFRITVNPPKGTTT